MNIANKIIYQIYPKSFKDSNGDGYGDIKGIIQKLDYLEALGIDFIWITPMFLSPQNDNGYDVQDYYNIDPRFGSNTDMDQLILEAKNRGIEIMFDMVLNHTSTHHEWFQKAKSGNKKYQDFYFFVEKPVNWQSKFGGSAFKYLPNLNVYYLHLYDETQADLNWSNPEVIQELADIVNYWIEKGIKGFRFDVINLVSKPDVFEDDFKGDGRRFYTDGPHVHEYIHELNQKTFGQHTDILTVGELSSTDIDNAIKYTQKKRNELHTIFNFHHLKADYQDDQNKWMLASFDFMKFKKLFIEWQEAMLENDGIMSLFLNNHDQPRAVSRFACDKNFHYESATMLATSIFLMRGVPFIYQGEEIGLPNAYFSNIESYRDVESINAYHALKKEKNENEVLHILQERSRDNGRTPMIWNMDEYHGFSSQEPWIPFSQHKGIESVEEQEKNPGSILNFYKKLIQIRKENEIFSEGDIQFFYQDHPYLMAYTRNYEDKSIAIIANYSKNNVELEETIKSDILLHNYNDSENQIKNLRPYEVYVLKMKN